MIYAVVLDANVLIPSFLRNTLLRIAAEGVYCPLWSAQIWDEVIRNTPKACPSVSKEAARRRAQVVLEMFDQAMVDGWQPLEAAMTNDLGDRHVLAAAVAGHANAIVTENLEHFPAASRSPYGIDLHHPDDFLQDQLDLDPGRVMQALEKQAAATGAADQPVLTISDVLERLQPKIPGFVAEANDALTQWGYS